MAADQTDIQKFYSSNGAETRSLQNTFSSAESCSPMQETSEIGGPHPCARPYASAAEAQMWTAVEMLKELEAKLRPIYDGLTHHGLTEEKTEWLEQQAKITQTCDTILQTVTIIERRLAQVPDRPATGDVKCPHSHWPNQPVYKGLDESATLPKVMLMSIDDPYGLSGVQVDGQPTCAFVVSRSNHRRVKKWLEVEEIKSQCYYVENSEKTQHDKNIPYFHETAKTHEGHHEAEPNLEDDINHIQLGATANIHGVTGHAKLKEAWQDDNGVVASKIVESNNNEGEEGKTGLWNVVADILNRTDDVGSIKVKVKDVKEAYQQQRQLENELMQLNSTISERNSLLEEKEQTIENLNRMLADTSGHLQTEQGQVNELIGHQDKMLAFLTRKLPDAVPINENTKAGNIVQPQRTEGIPKPAKPWPTADLTSDLKSHENNNFKEVREEKLNTNIINANIVTDTVLKPEATVPTTTQMKPESADAGDCVISKPVTKEKDKETTKQPPNPEDQSTSEAAVKNQHMHSKASKTTAKGSADFTEKSGESTKTPDADDNNHALKSPSEQQVKKDEPKNKPNTHSYSKLSKLSDNKVGTPVDP